jgi:hypothetical protein
VDIYERRIDLLIPKKEVTMRKNPGSLPADPSPVYWPGMPEPLSRQISVQYSGNPIFF